MSADFKEDWFKSETEEEGEEEEKADLKESGGQERSQCKVKCEKCGKILKRSSLGSHLKYYHGGAARPSVECQDCGKPFTDKQQLRDHILFVHQGIRKHECKTCDKFFATEKSLRKHIKCLHGQERSQCKVKCEKCGKILKRSSLGSHLKYYHGGAARPSVECQDCGKPFIDKQQLRDHIVFVHQGIRKHECNTCDKFFATKKSLRKHIQCVHEKKEVSQCSVCGLSLKTKGALNAHLKIHSGRTEAQKDLCPHCGKAFLGKASLKVHINDKHTLKEISKDYLKQITQQEKDRAVQLIEKSDIYQVSEKLGLPVAVLKSWKEKGVRTRPVVCTECGKTVQHRGLYLHMKTHAPDTDSRKPQLKKNQSKTKTIKEYPTQNPKYKVNSQSQLVEIAKSAKSRGFKETAERFSLEVDTVRTFYRMVFQPIQCEYCPFKAAWQPKMKQHILRWHKAARDNKCHLCEFETSIYEELSRHLRTKHEIFVNPHPNLDTIEGIEIVSDNTKDEPNRRRRTMRSMKLHSLDQVLGDLPPSDSEGLDDPSPVKPQSSTGILERIETLDAELSEQLRQKRERNRLLGTDEIYNVRETLKKDSVDVDDHSIHYKDESDEDFDRELNEDAEDEDDPSIEHKDEKFDIHDPRSEQKESNDYKQEVPVEDYSHDGEDDLEDNDGLVVIKNEIDILDFEHEGDSGISTLQERRLNKKALPGDSALENVEYEDEDLVIQTVTYNTTEEDLDNMDVEANTEESEDVSNMEAETNKGDEKDVLDMETDTTRNEEEDVTKMELKTDTEEEMYIPSMEVSIKGREEDKEENNKEVKELIEEEENFIKSEIKIDDGEEPVTFENADSDYTPEEAGERNKKKRIKRKGQPLGRPPKGSNENSPCTICGKTLKDKYKMRDHLLTHSTEKNFNCDLCSSSFSTASYLQKHKRFIHETLEEGLQCSFCGKVYHTKSSLDAHIHNNHQTENRKLDVCETCGNVFKGKSSLQAHIRRIHLKLGTQGLQSFCDKCGRGFPCSQNNLRFKKHYERCEGKFRANKGTTSFPCTECGKVFNRSNNLKVHMTKHSRVKEFQCRICDAKFVAKRTLIQHTEKNHPEAQAQFEVEKTFSCDKCGASFSTRTSLWEHLISSHGLPHPVRCRDCKEGFWARDERLSHRKECGGKLEKVLEHDWRKDY